MKKLNLLILILMCSCSHLSSVSQTSIPKNKSKMVTTKVENGVFFLFNFNNTYIDTITKNLADQCPTGSVKGILTKDVNITYFPIIYHKNIITASGYCVEERKVKKGKRI